MAVSIIVSVARKKIKLDLDSKKITQNLGTKGALVITGKGILISLANPYWYVWWMTIGAAFMVKSVQHSYGGVASFYTGHILADFIWYLFVGFLISTGRRFFNQKVYIGILISCSVFLLYLGIRFIAGFMLS